MQYSSSEYLAELLPAILQMSSRPPAPEPIVIQVLVRDELTNRYAYRFDREQLQVLHGLADDVDLTMTFMSDDLLAFSANKLDLGRALKTQRLSVQGDLELLPWFARRLASHG